MSGQLQTEKEIWIDWYNNQHHPITQECIGTFPLYGILNGICRCPLGSKCRNTAKHPKHRQWADTIGSYINSVDNVGVSTHNLVVLDIDDPDTVDYRQYPETFMTKTRKGYHLWYWANPTVPIMTKVAWVPHVDIRAVGGLIVAPPSRHESGHIYAPFNDVPIQEVPEELLELLPLKSEQQKLGHAVDLSKQTTSEFVLPVLDSICNKIRFAQKGQRNQELFRQTCQVLRYIDEGQMGTDALYALAEAAEDNGLTSDEILTTFNSAKRSI